MSETTTIDDNTNATADRVVAVDPPAEAGIFDAAGEGDPAPDENGKAQRPAWLSEEFWDAEKAAPRVEQLAKSQKDLRAQISKSGRATPPESPDKYTLPVVEGLPDGAVGGENDTLWPKIRGEAHKAGISDAQLQAVAKPYLEELAANLKRQQDAADPEKNKEARRAVLEAELGKLGPNGRTVARGVGTWLDGLATRGVLAAAEVASLKSIGDATGVRALLKLREMAGEMAVPVEALDAEGGTQADAERMLQEGHAKGDQAMITRARARLGALERGQRLAL